jgi:GH24 family phage-related lysozyme (muramidase)
MRVESRLVVLSNTVTQRGLHVIKQWERYRAIPYNDGVRPNGMPIFSKGFGHSDQLDTVPFDNPAIWTLEYASDVLENYDLPYYGKLLAAETTIPDIPDTLYSCIISLCMNKGVRRLVESDQWKILLDTTNKYNKEDFCVSILDYAVHNSKGEYKKGLKYRRIAEAGLFMQDRFPDYV